MESTSIRWDRSRLLERAHAVDWAAVALWLLCFGLVAYLGLEGGGYDPLVSDQVGIAVWWALLAGVAVGALPRRHPGGLALATLALLATFVAWTALSLTWTESVERTWADLARILAFLGTFLLVLLARGPGDMRRIVGAVGAAIAVVALVALLSRLHPAWFPDADQTAAFLSNNRERLSYPLHYWNGLAALIAIGLPLVLWAATATQSLAIRSLSTAVLPAMGLAAFLTLSRAGLAAAIVALAVFLAFTSDRLPAILTMLLSGGATAILIGTVTQRDALQDGLLNAAARQQGDEMLAITLGVCLVVGLAGAALSYALLNGMRPAWARISRRQATVTASAGALAVLLAAAAFGGPGRAADGWDEFKRGEEGPGTGTGRLGSVAGQNRYQYWSSAARENATRPLSGTGSGTFEFWWTRDGNGDIVRDAHSLYLQTFGELGIVGLALLAGSLLMILVGGVRGALLARAKDRPPLAAALAGCTAFCLTAAFDWMWQIPVLPIATLLLAVVLVGSAARDGEVTLQLPLRIATVVVAIVAIVAIAIPLASTSLLRQSEAEARDGDLISALEDARSAQNVQPSAAAPRLQQALVLEQFGDLGAAAEAARAAIDRERTNWRTWFVLSRIEAQRGRAAAAVLAYREARSLNPYSTLFE